MFSLFLSLFCRISVDLSPRGWGSTMPQGKGAVRNGTADVVMMWCKRLPHGLGMALGDIWKSLSLSCLLMPLSPSFLRIVLGTVSQKGCFCSEHMREGCDNNDNGDHFINSCHAQELTNLQIYPLCHVEGAALRASLCWTCVPGRKCFLALMEANTLTMSPNLPHYVSHF